MPVFSCLSLWGPLGLVLGFYSVQVWHLDVAHSDSKFKPTKHGWGTPPPHLTCFIWVFGDAIRWLQACGMLCDIAPLGLHAIGFESCSRISGSSTTRVKDENERIFFGGGHKPNCLSCWHQHHHCHLGHPPFPPYLGPHSHCTQ